MAAKKIKKTRKEKQPATRSVSKLAGNIRSMFPLIENKNIAYLDSAATTQKPKIVIDTIKKFYENSNANSHRGIYALSEEATEMLHEARSTISQFINASTDEIIFVKNSTEGFNNLANSLEKTLVIDPAHNIVTTSIEHHSNYLPWQQLCKRTGAEFRVCGYDVDKDNIENISSYVDDQTTVVAFTAMSNVTGLIIDVKEQISEIRKKNKDVVVVVDATQIMAHSIVDVKDLDADFLIFSAHKIYGPTGVGILFGKYELLEKIEPFNYGGNMINKVYDYDSDWAPVPDKFEAGTIDTPGIVAAAKAIGFFNDNHEKIFDTEKELQDYALKELKKISGLRIIGHDADKKSTKSNIRYGPVISFTMDKLHPHDIATICDENGVCIRAGHHCAQPLLEKLGVIATSRMSIGAYTNKSDIDRLVKALNITKKTLL